jgi:hypothetical protein
MIKHIIILLFILPNTFVFCQDTLNLTLVWEKIFKGDLVGSIDEQQNTFLFDGSELIKINDKSEIVFHQSIKSLGTIKEIDARNPFKILLFSENQQSINFIDNSLSLQNETIDLSNFDLNNVISTSGSDQMDKCWVYNQDNSTLKLIGKNEQQFQSISNLKKLVSLNSIDKIKEANSLLFLLDFTGKIVLLDMYGNLKSHFDFSPYTSAFMDQSMIYLQQDKTILVFNYIKNLVVGYIKTPSNSTLIGKKGDFFFFTLGNKLGKFTISN